MKARQAGLAFSEPGTAWTGAEVLAFDAHLQSVIGLPAGLLMENAAAAVAAHALEMAKTQGVDRIVLICGPGHNGGDVAVAARHLAGTGMVLSLFLPLGPPASGSATESALQVVRRLGIPVHATPPPFPVAEEPSLWVDGLFGLGLNRPLEGAARVAVELINQSGQAILSVDLPSGLHADTGEILGVAVRATRTLSFVAPKRGMLLASGPACCGKVHVAGIGVSEGWAAEWLQRHRNDPTG